MPKLPWNKWFFQDWLSDPHLSMCSPAARGIWKDMLAAMVLSDSDRLLIDDTKLARICRCTPAELSASVVELFDTKTASCVEQDGNRYIVCRRLEREAISKENKSKAGIASATQRQQASASASVSSFDAFWQAYPKKVGKAAALKAWRKHEPDIDKCLSVLKWQVGEWQQGDKKFIPHPSTWLNRGSWNDEACTVKKERVGTANGAVI